MEQTNAAGWMLLLAGASVIFVIVLTPAWLDVRELEAQRLTMHRTSAAIALQQQNYESFIRAVDARDPLLTQRLAMAYLNLKPAGAELVDHRFDPTAHAADHTLTVDHWTAPQLPLMTTRAAALPETRLTRLVLGPTRPWVLAFGGWLILMGLLINPSDSNSDSACPS